MRSEPSGSSYSAAVQWPVTVKAVVLRDGCVLLARKDRNEWELPGGQVEPGESTRQTLVRELREETGLDVSPGPLLLAEPFEVVPGVVVFVVAYGATAEDQMLKMSAEHTALAYMPLTSFRDIELPEIYRQAIAAASA